MGKLHRLVVFCVFDVLHFSQVRVDWKTNKQTNKSLNIFSVCKACEGLYQEEASV